MFEHLFEHWKAEVYVVNHDLLLLATRAANSPMGQGGRPAFRR
jgi:hypothetical protein